MRHFISPLLAGVAILWLVSSPDFQHSGGERAGAVIAVAASWLVLDVLLTLAARARRAKRDAAAHARPLSYTAPSRRGR